MAFQAGAIKVRIELLTKQLQEGVKAAKGHLQTLKRVGVAAVNALKTSFKALAVTVKAVGTSIRVVGRTMMAPFRALRHVLTRSIFTLKNLIFVLGAALFIRRAKEVETIGAGFNALNRSIGEVSSTMLTRLREATRGTVSDLELMRVTNNAILLGVARSADEFAELANAARRLGRAVGRDAVDALNDLAIGIGRQSRLILDNLGLIVKVGKANEDYARQLGKNVNKLTDAERRMAFFNATMDAVRRKLADLGPDVLTAGDQWDRLGAAISNTVSALATTLVGGDLPRILADFLQNSEQDIVSFVAAVELGVQKILAAIGRLYDNIMAGKADIAHFVSEAIAAVIRLAVVAIEAAFQAFGPLIVSGAVKVWEQLKHELALRIGRWWESTKLAILREFYKFLDFYGLGVIKIKISPEFERMRSQVSNARRELNRLNESAAISMRHFELLTEQVDKLEEGIEILAKHPEIYGAKETQFVTDLREELLELLETIRRLSGEPLELEAARKQWQESLDQLPEMIEGSKRTLKEAIDEFFDSIAKAAEPDEPGAKKVEETVKATLLGIFERVRSFLRAEMPVEEISVVRMKVFRAGDPLYKFRPLLTDRVIQPLATAVNWLERFSRALALRRPDLFSEGAVQRGRMFVKLLADGVVLANKLAVGLRRALTPRYLEPQAFADALKPFRDLAEKLEIEVEVAGLDEAAAQLKKLDLAFKGLALSPEQMRALEEFRTKFIEALRGREVAKLGEDLQKSIAAIDVELEKLELPPWQQQSAALRLAIRQITEELGAASPEAKNLVDLLAQLESREIRLKVLVEGKEFIARQVAFISDALSDGLVGGLASAWERGEKLSKAWASITADLFRRSMSQAIDGLRSMLQKALSGLFENLGRGAGGAGLASGLLGMGAAILANLQSKRESTIEDFNEAVNSAEAVRGVVAGPTNVAISKVGESMKQALRGTELLLEQILRVLEQGYAAGAGAGNRNSVMPLTGSTMS